MEGEVATQTRRGSGSAPASRGAGVSGGSAKKPRLADFFKIFCEVSGRAVPRSSHYCTYGSLAQMVKKDDCDAALLSSFMDAHPKLWDSLAKQRTQAVRRKGESFAPQRELTRAWQALLFHDTSGGDYASSWGAESVLNPAQMLCTLHAAAGADGTPGKMCGSIFTLTKGSIHRAKQHMESHTKKGPYQADAKRVLARLLRLQDQALPLDGPSSVPPCPPAQHVSDITGALGSYPTYVPFSHELTGYGTLVTGAAHVRPSRRPGETPATVTTMVDVASALRKVDTDFASKFAALAGIKPWPPRPSAAAPAVPTEEAPQASA